MWTRWEYEIGDAVTGCVERTEIPVCVCVNRNTRVISQLSEGWAGTGSSPSCIRKRAAEICTKRGWLLLGTSHSSPPNLALPSPDNLLLALKPQDVNRYSEKA